MYRNGPDMAADLKSRLHSSFQDLGGKFARARKFSPIPNSISFTNWLTWTSACNEWPPPTIHNLDWRLQTELSWMQDSVLVTMCFYPVRREEGARQALPRPRKFSRVVETKGQPFHLRAGRKSRRHNRKRENLAFGEFRSSIFNNSLIIDHWKFLSA